jgi:hypothetical protein
MVFDAALHRIGATWGGALKVEVRSPADQASTVWRALAATSAGGVTSLNTAKLSGISGMTGK